MHNSVTPSPPLHITIVYLCSTAWSTRHKSRCLSVSGRPGRLQQRNVTLAFIVDCSILEAFWRATERMNSKQPCHERLIDILRILLLYLGIRNTGTPSIQYLAFYVPYFDSLRQSTLQYPFYVCQSNAVIPWISSLQMEKPRP